MGQLASLARFMTSIFFLMNKTSVDAKRFGVDFEMGKNPAGCLFYIFRLSALHRSQCDLH